LEILKSKNIDLLTVFSTFASNFQNAPAPAQSSKSCLLNLLVNAKSHQFNPLLKKFAAFLFLRCGRRGYSSLCLNLPFPKLPTIYKYIQKGPAIKEGALRVQELEVFLTSRSLPKHVWISEDGTRVSPKIQFDSTNGEIVGLNLPTSKNGLPVVSFFKVNSAREMKHFIDKYQMPGNLYAVLATAMAVNSPTFCLCVFGTDNKFDADTVVRRWDTIRDMLSEVGVELLGVSSDGDSRLLKAMKKKTLLSKNNFGTPIEYLQWFNAIYEPDVICVQDAIHYGGRLRMRLLNMGKIIVMGK
jgi:hypothetical protein